MRFLLIAFVVAACGPSPTPTGTVCPDPDPLTLTYDNFGHAFMDKYCTWCHDSALPRAQRNGAPIYHDYDDLLGVLETHEHVDEQAGSGPDATNEFMPPDRCPSTKGGALDKNCAKPTKEEREKLAQWIACEVNRNHSFLDAGVDAP